MKKWTPIICTILLNIVRAIAQPDDASINQSQILPSDNFVQQVNDNIPEFISDNQEEGLDCNTLENGDLDQFEFLTETDKGLIYDYIRRHTPILSVYELQSIKALETWKVKLLIHVLKAERNKSNVWKAMRNFKQAACVMNWARARSSTSEENQFQGSQDRLRLRIQNAKPGLFSYGLMLEKDAGEKLILQKTRMPDFVSFHFYVRKPIGRIDALAIGDFSLRFGQGLILDNLYSPGRTASFGTLIKTPSQLKPFHSLGESAMLRGISVSFKWKHTQLLSFVSLKKLDANLIIDSIAHQSSKTKYTSISLSGLHRTAAELEDRHQLQQISSGLSLQQSYQRLILGVNLVAWNNEVERDIADRIDLRYTDVHALQLYASLHHSFRMKQITHFGEIGIQAMGQKALFDGLLIGISKNADAFIHWRYYDAGFSPLSGSAYASGSESRNEKGFMCGFNLSPYRKYQCTLFADHWRKNWLSYQFPSIDQGQEYSVRLTRTEKKDWSIYLQYNFSQHEERIQTTEDGIHLEPIEENFRHSLRIHLEKKLNAVWTWRCRYEYHIIPASKDGKTGQMMYSDLLFKSIERPYSGSFRLSIFNTPNYETRIYAYENDLLFQNGIPLYYGNGLRSYVNFRWKMKQHLSIELRFARTYYFTNEKSDDDGSNTIHWDTEEIKMQLYYRF